MVEPVSKILLTHISVYVSNAVVSKSQLIKENMPHIAFNWLSMI